MQHHEGYSCEEFDVKYHAGLAKLWDALEPQTEGPNIRISPNDVFEEAARQIKDYHKLLGKFIINNGEPVGWIPGPK